MSMELEYKYFGAQKIELKVDLQKRTFEGYAATFEKPEDADSHGDIFAQGAFAESIKKDGPDGTRRIVVLWVHRQSEPIGVPLSLSEDTRGLLTKTKTSQFGKGPDVLGWLDEETVTGLSVGFRTQAFEFLPEFLDRWGFPVRKINKARLFEYSPVPIPSNPFARVQKALELRQEQYQQWSAEHGLSASKSPFNHDQLIRIERRLALEAASRRIYRRGRT